MKVFSVELDNINNKAVPRVELDYKFQRLSEDDIKEIHELISKCYVDVMTIFIKNL